MGSVTTLPNLRELENQVLALRALAAQLCGVLIDRGVLHDIDICHVVEGAEAMVRTTGRPPHELLEATSFTARHYYEVADIVRERVDAKADAIAESDRKSLEAISRMSTG